MPCSLTPKPDSLDWESHTGTRVTLVTQNQVGSVFVSSAVYGDTELVPPGQAVSRLTFDVATGRNTLKLVCVYSASERGRGELREDCQDASQFIRPLRGDEPLQLIKIFGL